MQTAQYDMGVDNVSSPNGWKQRLHVLTHSQEVGLVVLLALLLVGLYYFAWRGMRFYLVP